MCVGFLVLSRCSSPAQVTGLAQQPPPARAAAPAGEVAELSTSVTRLQADVRTLQAQVSATAEHLSCCFGAAAMKGGAGLNMWMGTRQDIFSEKF